MLPFAQRQFPADPRFAAKIDIGSVDQCWPWMGYRDRWGYGKLKRGGKVIYAHRRAWAMCKGPIPGNQCVCHSCDNPACCNPAHLGLGTNDENMADRRVKGRATTSYQVGQANNNAKLTVADVRTIRADPRIARVVAAEYGVHRTTISLIRQGKTWSDVAGQGRCRATRRRSFCAVEGDEMHGKGGVTPGQGPLLRAGVRIWEQAALLLVLKPCTRRKQRRLAPAFRDLWLQQHGGGKMLIPDSPETSDDR